MRTPQRIVLGLLSLVFVLLLYSLHSGFPELSLDDYARLRDTALDTISDYTGPVTELSSAPAVAEEKEGEAGAATISDVSLIQPWTLSSPTSTPAPSFEAVATPNLANNDPVLATLLDPQPRVDFARFAERPPHNAEDESGNAYALYLCTRDPEPGDPYFAATQVTVYRLLWEYRTKHRVVVFVCPWTPESQRTTLRGQGAAVKEVGEWQLDIPLHLPRWKDVFGKLHMWNATEYKKLALFDADAFPMQNIDEIFDLIGFEHCRAVESEKVSDKTPSVEEGACDYVFAGVNTHHPEVVNAGFMVFSPNAVTYESFVRNTQKTNLWSFNEMEQGFLSSNLAFGLHGPRPMRVLDRKWNFISGIGGAEDTVTDDASTWPKVLHQKLWSGWIVGQDRILSTLWDAWWMRQCRFYDGKEFALARETGYFRTALEAYYASMSNDTYGG